MWNTVVDFRKIINMRHIIVSSDVATAIPAKIVATLIDRLTLNETLSHETVTKKCSPETTSTACPSSPPTFQRNCHSFHYARTLSKALSDRQSLILSRQPIPVWQSSPPRWCCNILWRLPTAPQLPLNFWCNSLHKAAMCPHTRSLSFPSFIAPNLSFFFRREETKIRRYNHGSDWRCCQRHK